MWDMRFRHADLGFENADLRIEAVSYAVDDQSNPLNMIIGNFKKLLAKVQLSMNRNLQPENPQSEISCPLSRLELYFGFSDDYASTLFLRS